MESIFMLNTRFFAIIPAAEMNIVLIAKTSTSRFEKFNTKRRKIFIEVRSKNYRTITHAMVFISLSYLSNGFVQLEMPTQLGK